MMKKKTYEERLYGMTRQFTTGDTQFIIDSHTDVAGLILMPVFAGMIGLGHALYGYGLTDREAFLKFAQYRMKIQKAFAEILFDNVRAGLIVQWCSEVRTVLVAWAPAADGLCWQDEGTDTRIVINTAEVGRVYLSAVHQLPDYCDTQKHQEIRDEKRIDELREQVARFRSTL